MPCTLGINLSHTGAACLIGDGRVLAAVAEERLSRLKGDAGFPTRSIEAVLRIALLDPREIDTIAVGTLCERFEPRLAQEQEYRPSIRAAAWISQALPLPLLGSKALRRAYRGLLGSGRRIETRWRHLPYLADLGIRPKRVLHLDHHDCHAAAAYHLRPFAGDATVLTCDGLGDGLAATVSLGAGGGLRRVAETSSVHSLGSMYSRITRALGLKPWEHEHKVMGLAPHANPERAKDLAEDFLGFLEVEGLELRNRSGVVGDAFLRMVQRRYGTRRFDDLAYAIQHLAERRLREWAEAAVQSTGVRRLCAAGGVFLNVKANAQVAASSWIDRAFFFPAPGDESIAIGAALLAEKRVRGVGGSTNGRLFEPVGTSLWGPEIEDDLDRVLAALDRDRFEVEFLGAGLNRRLAELLAKGEIVARAEGRMEFGPRALGNRSILADPSRLEVVGELNRTIKNRDFWMPFAPAIQSDLASRYLRQEASPHMMLACETRTAHRHELQAALHGADFSARPQIVDAELYPGFHGLIEEFRRRRGIGALLNTSFNLHGFPLVCSTADALEVLESSALRNLAIGGHLVRKRDPSLCFRQPQRSDSRNGRQQP